MIIKTVKRKAAALAVLVELVLSIYSVTCGGHSPLETDAERKPNIVLVLIDDLDWVLGGMVHV